MYIHRDITQQLTQNPVWVQILIGPRQCGKSTLFTALALKEKHFQEITFDDLQLRQLANRDPALFLQQFEPPLVLDEIQYVPNLFSEIKKRVDDLKKTALFQGWDSSSSDGDSSEPKPQVLFRLTGSNQLLMDRNIKESLAGRASFYYLNTLSVHEILTALPEIKINDILFKGGWPELYTEQRLSVTSYLNDYIRTYVEKDIFITVGIHKITEFHTVLGLLGARTGQLLDFSDIANNSGVSSVTVKEWSNLLVRTDLIYFLKPYFSNLNKRLIKTPKLYFLDTGLAVRLQGWQEKTPLLNSPQIGALFETLVLAELVKFIRNYKKDWELFFWRTKEGEEIDFILKTNTNNFHAFEAKLAIQNVPIMTSYPPAFHKHFSPTTPLAVVTFGGKKLKVSEQCLVLPIAELHDYLQEL